jgi:hypothetical protein
MDTINAIEVAAGKNVLFEVLPDLLDMICSPNRLVFLWLNLG